MWVCVSKSFHLFKIIHQVHKKQEISGLQLSAQRATLVPAKLFNCVKARRRRLGKKWGCKGMLSPANNSVPTSEGTAEKVGWPQQEPRKACRA